MKLDELMSNGKYLPDFMRDFHDQKLLFKIIGEIVERAKTTKENYTDLPNWVAAHIYVVDFFLWFMARRGWTLQRSRVRTDFLSLEDDIRQYREKEKQLFDQMMDELRKQKEPA